MEKGSMFNIYDFGAIGDGVTDNAVFIQAAIDACHESGGGNVVIPGGGVFLSGPFCFKSNVNLVVEANAILKASTDESLYTESAFKENRSEGSLWISGFEAHRIGISGRGVIDGQGTQFMVNEEKTHYNYRIENNVDMRPHLLTLIGCHSITIKDVTFKNAAYWCIHPVGCEDVLITGVRILNSLKVRNCDGIDPDHCRNVRISNCYIESADDCICPKTRREYEEYGPTENMTVTGCTLVSTSCAIKLGSENVSGIRNIVFSSIVINASNRALGIQNRDEGVIENIQFNNIIIESRLFADVWWGKAEPISVTAFKRPKGALARFARGETEGRIGPVRNIGFHNINATSENGIYVCGCPESRPSNIFFDNVSITLSKTTHYQGGMYDRRPCNVEGIVREKTAGFFIQEADDVRIRDCRVVWGENQPAYYGEALKQRAVVGLEISGFQERNKKRTSKQKPVLFFDCGDTLIDEGTEVKDEHGISLDAELIPGGDVLIRTLAERGYTMALVADGYTDTFKNLLGKYGLYDYFSAYAISQEVGVCKPDPRMFLKVLDDLQISEEGRDNVWMIGNNLARDIKGANRLGLVSVWLDWAPRRSKIPADQWEIPNHTVKTPLEIIDLLDLL